MRGQPLAESKPLFVLHSTKARTAYFDFAIIIRIALLCHDEYVSIWPSDFMPFSIKE
jgi:hypothetical protein